MNNQDKYIFAGLYTIVVAIVIAIITVLVYMIRTDGVVQYCYIQAAPSQGPQIFHTLHGYRPWKADITMGIFSNFDDAVKAANVAQCPLTK